MPSITYPRSCLLDAPCTDEVREAALLDYVGAAYGDEENRYDGVLTTRERRNIELAFGPAPRGEDPWQWRRLATAYIAAARPRSVVARSPFIDPRACDQPMPMFHRDHIRPALIAVGGYHGCTDRFLGALDQEGFELGMAAAPETWHFFIEGARYIFRNAARNGSRLVLPQEAVQGGQNISVIPGEVVHFLELGRRLNIPVDDPVIPPSTQEFCAEAARQSSHGVAEYQAIVGVETIEHLVTAFTQTAPSAMLDGAILWEDAVQTVMEYYGSGRIEAEQGLTTLCGGGDRAKIFRQPIAVASAYAWLRGTVGNVNARFEELLTVSNTHSAAHIRTVIAAAKAGVHLYIVGRYHLDLVTSAYQ
ncbi:MAG: hypothetical protein HY543_02030 [Deltaproteobacteria bacterium]|nr:hypothetical protein [Deltaproteobacteria bacterium]